MNSRLLAKIRMQVARNIEKRDDYSEEWQKLMRSLERLGLAVVCGDIDVEVAEREAELKKRQLELAISINRQPSAERE